MLKRLVLLFLSSLSVTAYAGIKLEPYVGYAMGNLKMTEVGSTASQSASVDGFTYGGRAGLTYGYFFLGGDYQASRAQLKFDGAGESTNWQNTSIFGLLGVDLGFGLSLHAGMTVMPHESEYATTPVRTVFKGKAKKAGLSYHYHGLPFAINGEYVIYEFDKFEIGETRGKIDERWSKFDYSAIVLYLSFPFEFGGR